MNSLPMILRLVSGSDMPSSASRNSLFVGVDQRHVVVVAEHGHDLFGLAFAQETVIDKNAGKLIADGLVDEDGSD